MLYRLVVDASGPEPVHVFLPARHAGGPPGESVLLHEVRPPAASTVLGRSVRDATWYREFRSDIEMLVGGYEPVGSYRVCDSWAEYLDPWCGGWTEQPTERMACP